MSLPPFAYVAPGTADEVVGHLREQGDDAVLIAGGLTVVTLMRERLLRPRVVVGLSALAGLRGIEEDGDECVVGAMTTYAEVHRSSLVRLLVPILAEACGRVGSPAIRNMGTVGGAVALGDAASDVSPALLALGAHAVIYGPHGERSLPLEHFFHGVLTTDLGEHEFLTGLRIPRLPAGAMTRYVKYTCTSEEAFAAVTVAAMVKRGEDGSCTDARIGLGSVAPAPIRAGAAEEALRGRPLTPAAIAEAADLAAAGTDPGEDGQGSPEYRRELTRVLVGRLLTDMRENGGKGTR